MMPCFAPLAAHGRDPGQRGNRLSRHAGKFDTLDIQETGRHVSGSVDPCEDSMSV